MVEGAVIASLFPELFATLAGWAWSKHNEHPLRL